MLFSIIIPTYNRADLLIKTLASVFAQRMTDYEVIVIDDGSTDETPRVLAGYGERVRTIRQENGGQPKARNTGIAAARGRYAAFLDSDDLWMPWALDAYAEAIRKHGEPASLVGGVREFRDEAELDSIYEAPLETRYSPDYFSVGGWATPSAAAVRLDYLRESGGFHAQRFLFEENDLWMRLGTYPGFVRMISPITCGRRWHASNATRPTNMGVFIRGARHMIEEEQAGHYPGGDSRRRDRLAALTESIRPLAVGCARSGMLAEGWELYRKTLRWNLSLGRVKFVAGFPALSAAEAVRHGRGGREEQKKAGAPSTAHGR